MQAIPTGHSLGARIEGLDLSHPLSSADRDQLIRWAGQYGVLIYPEQQLTPAQLRDFAANFGELEVNVATMGQQNALPEVMTLSNIVENGKPLGLSDAGQSWHTDMSYSSMIAFANILYGIEIPVRDGQPLGNTEFCNMHAAYAGLPDELKRKLDGKTITHDFNKFWEMMRTREGSTRKPLTEEQRRAKPPVSHPVFLTHPITGKKVLYANPGYSMRINELPEDESERILDFLFKHQLKPEYRYAFKWEVGSVLMWDNMGTIHNAVADYRPEERRLIKRCQVSATRFFNDAAPAGMAGTYREAAGAQ
jgi:taurine dioxygenase